MTGLIQRVINRIENSATSFWLWLAAFSGIIIIRLLVENWLANFQSRSGLSLFYEFTHTFLFFTISYVLFAVLINKFLKVEIKKAANVLLWGFLIIVAPPIIDYIISRGKGFWSFYEFDGLKGLVGRFLTFFGSTPEIGITYGVRVEVALALAFIFIYSLIKLSTQKNSQLPNSNFQQESKLQNNEFGNRKTGNKLTVIIKSLGITIVAYTVFFILGTFPSWVAIAIKGLSKGFLAVTDVDVARMFLTPARIFRREIPDIVSALNIRMSIVYSLVLTLLLVVSCWLLSREKLKAFLANARFPQLIYHGGLLCVGMGLAFIFTDIFVEINFFNAVSFLVLLLSVFCAWLASVVINDIRDKDIDKITNKARPLAAGIFTLEEYKTVGWILFFVSISFSAIVNFKIALLLLVYQTIAWLYSCPPLRLKRFAFISTFTSAVASLMILFSGFVLASPEHDIKGLPFSLVALLVIGYTLALPIKDFKDIEGDKKNGVWTVPVLFGEQWGKVIVGAGIFLSFVLSVILFNEPRLFWWALLFGSSAFWIVINKNINPRRLPWWILGVIISYGLIILNTVFIHY